MTSVFTGTIREGKLFLDKAGQFNDYLHTFPNEKRVEVTVEKLKHPRTGQPNRYYWAVVVGEIAKHTGHDPEQIHELLKTKFSPKWHFDDRATPLGLVISTSTTRLMRENVSDELLKCIFDNPRVHTDKGRYLVNN